jgi:predicted peptidase
VLSPQCPDSIDWDTETLYALIKHIVSEYRIDKSMIWVTGLSMGGWATWDLAMAYPDYFAAIAPVCGRVSRNYPSRAADLKSLPVWVFHGANDDVVPVREQAKMVKALKACGNEARFTIYPLSGHDSWTETYDNPELYEWFLMQKRK